MGFVRKERYGSGLGFWYLGKGRRRSSSAGSLPLGRPSTSPSLSLAQSSTTSQSPFHPSSSLNHHHLLLPTLVKPSSPLQQGLLTLVLSPPLRIATFPSLPPSLSTSPPPPPSLLQRQHRRRSPSRSRSRSRSPGRQATAYRHRVSLTLVSLPSSSSRRCEIRPSFRADTLLLQLPPSFFQDTSMPPAAPPAAAHPPRSQGGPFNAPAEEAAEFATRSVREHRVYVGNLSYEVRYKDLEQFMTDGALGLV